MQKGQRLADEDKELIFQVSINNPVYLFGLLGLVLIVGIFLYTRKKNKERA